MSPVHAGERVDRVVGSGGVITEGGGWLEGAKLDPTHGPGLRDFLDGLQSIYVCFAGLDTEALEDVGVEGPEDGRAAGLDFGGESVDACAL